MNLREGTKKIIDQYDHIRKMYKGCQEHLCSPICWFDDMIKDLRFLGAENFELKKQLEQRLKDESR